MAANCAIILSNAKHSCLWHCLFFAIDLAAGSSPNITKTQPEWISEMGTHYTSSCHTREMHLAADSYSLPLKERPNIWEQAGELFLEWTISFPCSWSQNYIALIESIHQLKMSTSLQFPAYEEWLNFN